MSSLHPLTSHLNQNFSAEAKVVRGWLVECEEQKPELQETFARINLLFERGYDISFKREDLKGLVQEIKADPNGPAAFRYIQAKGIDRIVESAYSFLQALICSEYAKSNRGPESLSTALTALQNLRKEGVEELHKLFQQNEGNGFDDRIEIAILTISEAVKGITAEADHGVVLEALRTIDRVNEEVKKEIKKCSKYASIADFFETWTRNLKAVVVSKEVQAIETALRDVQEKIKDIEFANDFICNVSMIQERNHKIHIDQLVRGIGPAVNGITSETDQTVVDEALRTIDRVNEEVKLRIADYELELIADSCATWIENIKTAVRNKDTQAIQTALGNIEETIIEEAKIESNDFLVSLQLFAANFGTQNVIDLWNPMADFKMKTSAPALFLDSFRSLVSAFTGTYRTNEAEVLAFLTAEVKAFFPHLNDLDGLSRQLFNSTLPHLLGFLANQDPNFEASRPLFDALKQKERELVYKYENCSLLLVSTDDVKREDDIKCEDGELIFEGGLVLKDPDALFKKYPWLSESGIDTNNIHTVVTYKGLFGRTKVEHYALAIPGKNLISLEVSQEFKVKKDLAVVACAPILGASISDSKTLVTTFLNQPLSEKNHELRAEKERLDAAKLKEPDRDFSAQESAQKAAQKELRLAVNVRRDFQNALLDPLLAGLKQYDGGILFASPSHFHGTFKKVVLEGFVQLVNEVMIRVLRPRSDRGIMEIVSEFAYLLDQSFKSGISQFMGTELTSGEKAKLSRAIEGLPEGIKQQIQAIKP